MAKATNIGNAGKTYAATSPATEVNGVKLLPKIDLGQQNTGVNTMANNSLGGKVNNLIGNIKSAYNKNPQLYKGIGTSLLSALGGIAGGIENRNRRHNLITASYYKNPYLMSSLQQPTDYSEYYADLINNLYLSKKAREEKQQQNMEQDNSWNNTYSEMNNKLVDLKTGIANALGKTYTPTLEDYDGDFPAWIAAQGDILNNNKFANNVNSNAVREYLGEPLQNLGTLSDYGF